jgi:hypothetical protein
MPHFAPATLTKGKSFLTMLTEKEELRSRKEDDDGSKIPETGVETEADRKGEKGGKK